MKRKYRNTGLALVLASAVLYFFFFSNTDSPEDVRFQHPASDSNPVASELVQPLAAQQQDTMHPVSLSLEGIIINSDSDSIAIIRSNNGGADARAYKTGDNLDDGFVLATINKNHVILMKGNESTRLNLQQLTSSIDDSSHPDNIIQPDNGAGTDFPTIPGSIAGTEVDDSTQVPGDIDTPSQQTDATSATD